MFRAQVITGISIYIFQFFFFLMNSITESTCYKKGQSSANKYVLRNVLNLERKEACLTWKGRSFQNFGAVTAKAQLPLNLRLVFFHLRLVSLCHNGKIWSGDIYYKCSFEYIARCVSQSVSRI